MERSYTHWVRIPENIPVNMTTEVDDMASDVHSGSSTEQFRSFLVVVSLNASVAGCVLIHHLIGHHYNNNCQICVWYGGYYIKIVLSLLVEKDSAAFYLSLYAVNNCIL
ncbi:hypothetical protein Ddye_023213 [Dipteronia dyeriana]|uniref:Uncharacterized protein n=1 Tax=Dipteronia dyeriana TaxID=168575 RepID=A0AAD9TSI4_9ROSI|nr:hypothetical protein Ddye_023213 [Dipteronia dyeriana]